MLYSRVLNSRGLGLYSIGLYSRGLDYIQVDYIIFERIELYSRGLYYIWENYILRELFLRGLYIKADLLENLKKHPKEQEFFLLKKNPCQGDRETLFILKKW